MNYGKGTILARREVEKGLSGTVTLFRVESLLRHGVKVTRADGQKEYRPLPTRHLWVNGEWVATAPIEAVLFGYRVATSEEAARFGR